MNYKQKVCQTGYLAVDELGERIKFSKQTLYNMIFKGCMNSSFRGAI